jgi:hypothetical protein
MPFSDFGQDEFVVAILGEMREGFFIESGAFDGVQGSNTLLLEHDYHWQGMCIEANDSFYRQLIANRRCACVHACLYHGDGTVDFLESAATAGGILQEYTAEQTAFVQRVHAPPADDAGAWITVPKATRSLASLLDDYRAPRIIDYWSLDTEGSELAILSSFPFERYPVRVLTVEHCHLPHRRAAIARLLEERGYIFLAELGIDDCYIAAWNLHSRRSLMRRRHKH